MVVRPRKTNLGKFEMESFVPPYFLHWWPSSYNAYVSVVQLVLPECNAQFVRSLEELKGYNFKVT
jgi:hypothetical protein